MSEQSKNETLKEQEIKAGANAVAEEGQNGQEEEPKHYSIVLRMRRVTYEDGYVSVPVTDAIIKRLEDGNLGINPEAFIEEAVRIGRDPRIHWVLEEQLVEAHPTQIDKPAERAVIDGRMIQKD